MKKVMKVILPILLVIAIIFAIGWYLTVYDRSFARDFLLAEAQKNDMRGNQKLSAWFYDRAYDFSGKDGNVAIALAEQYEKSGNFTKAEVTLSRAIRSGATVELYIALCNTYVKQDKLLDAVSLLANLTDSELSARLEELRPLPPEPDHEAGFYTQYIEVALDNDAGTTYFTTDGGYPSVQTTPYLSPIKLGAGETKICAITVAQNGLVSPMTILSYTVGGVIEPVIFVDVEMESAYRTALQMEGTKTLYTNDLWQITEFTLPDNITYLDDLSLLTYARKLTIEGKHLDNFEFLLPLTNLETLELKKCTFPATAMETLSRLPKLRELTMDDCGLSTIADLAGIQGLTYVNIANNTVRNLEVLSTIPTLQKLDLQHNAVVSLEPLRGLANLEELNVSYNALTSLAPLASCGLLTTLDVSHNLLESTEGLASLALLENVALDYNKLTSIADLSGCERLNRLTLSNNSVGSLSPIAKLERLETLDFSYNRVTEMPAFSANATLRVVDGSYNMVKSIDTLAALPELTYVYMDYNKITSVDALANCFHLVQVNVYGNAVKNVSKLTAHDVIVNYDPTKK